MEKTSGFIYIWFDRKKRRYYPGSHWGFPDDGYICSSTWMLRAYKRRPQDFKRRIIKTIYTTRLDLLKEEHRLLQMIKPEELGKRYYNLRRAADHMYHADRDKALSAYEKSSRTQRGRPKNPASVEKLRKTLTGVPLDENRKLKLAKAREDFWNSDEGKEVRSNFWKNMRGKKLSSELKAKLSKIAIEQGRKPPSMKGKQHTPETIIKLKSIGKELWANEATRRPTNQLHTSEAVAKMALTKSKHYEITKPDGSTEMIKGLKEYCTNNDLDLSVMYSIANDRGVYKSHRGLTVRKIDNP